MLASLAKATPDSSCFRIGGQKQEREGDNQNHTSAPQTVPATRIAFVAPRLVCGPRINA